jgi:hypothetical protein
MNCKSVVEGIDGGEIINQIEARGAQSLRRSNV